MTGPIRWGMIGQRVKMAKRSFSYSKMGRIGDLDQDFETLAYWQSRPPEERLKAVWDLTVMAYAMKGEDVSKQRLQRSVRNFQRS